MTVVEIADDEQAPPETVIAELRPGYLWRQTVIRFAEVRAVKNRGSDSPATSTRSSDLFTSHRTTDTGPEQECLDMDPILGIDLGTTNSVVSIIQDGKPVPLRDERGQTILPSVVGLDSAGRLLVGQAARNQALVAPERTVRSIKRKMGQDVMIRMGEQGIRAP